MNRRGPSARIAPVVDHREEDSSNGRRCHPRDSLGYRVGDPRNGPRGQLHAECGGQVVLDIPHFSIPPAHQAW